MRPSFWNTSTVPPVTMSFLSAETLVTVYWLFKA